MSTAVTASWTIPVFFRKFRSPRTKVIGTQRRCLHKFCSILRVYIQPLYHCVLKIILSQTLNCPAAAMSLTKTEQRQRITWSSSCSWACSIVSRAVTPLTRQMTANRMGHCFDGIHIQYLRNRQPYRFIDPDGQFGGVPVRAVLLLRHRHFQISNILHSRTISFWSTHFQ